MLTKLENLINPEVMGPMLAAELPAALKLANFAEVDTTLVGRPGDTLTIPQWTFTGEAQEVAEGEEGEFKQLAKTTSSVTVKKAFAGYEITDEAKLSGYEKPVEEALRQIKLAIALKLDKDFYAEIKENAKLKNEAGTKAIGYDLIVDSLDLFEDEEFGEDYVVFIHPKQLTQLRKDARFVAASQLGDRVVEKGVVGEICGAKVVMWKGIELNEGQTAYENFILKPGALALYMKRNVSLETARDISRGVDSLAGNIHYAVGIAREDCVVKFNSKK